MVTEFLIGIGINWAYDLIKTSAIDILKEENSELVDSIYNCIDCSAKKFFEHYGEKYGKSFDSFLARQDIYDVIVKQMFYSEQSLLKDKLNILGYNGISVDEEAFNYFIECLLNEMKNKFVLDKIIAEKESMKKINEIHDIISKNQIDKKSNKLNFTMKYENGEDIPFEKGRIYHKKFENGADQKIMIDQDGYHVESKDICGRITYCDINFDGRIKYIKFPYDLSEFELMIPKKQVIKQLQYAIPNGYGVVYEFKWGRKVIAEFNSLGKLTGLQADVRSHTDYNSKKILITPEEEEKEKIYEL